MDFNDFEQYIDRGQLNKTSNDAPLGAPPQQQHNSYQNNNQGYQNNGYQKKQWNNNNNNGYQKKQWNNNNNNGYQKKQWNNGNSYKRNDDQVVSHLNPNDDGVTHINLYNKGNTELGRDLSHFSNVGFTHPVFGTFMSIEGFWYWLSTGRQEDRLRTAYGFRAKKLGKDLPKVEMPPEEFKKHIGDAHKLRLEQNFLLKRKFIDSSLPFEHYYHYGEPPKVQLAAGQWIKDILEDLRRKMQAEHRAASQP